MSYVIGTTAYDLYPTGNPDSDLQDYIRMILVNRGINGDFVFHYETVLDPTTFRPVVVVRAIRFENEKDRFLAQLYGERKLLAEMKWKWP